MVPTLYFCPLSFPITNALAGGARVPDLLYLCDNHFNCPSLGRSPYGVSISDGKAIMRRRFAKARTNNEAEYMTLLASLKNLLMYRTDLTGVPRQNGDRL